MTDQGDLYARLARQSLGRPLTQAEDRLADALEKIFNSGCHDFPDVARKLQEQGVPRPSGSSEQWSVDGLMHELELINALLDEAYLERGSVEAPTTF